MGTKKPIIVYTTSWCGYCRATKMYLRSRDVEFVEKDIEVDGNARAELLRKVKTYAGVPVLDVGGTIILGFDREAIDECLQGNSFRKVA